MIKHGVFPIITLVLMLFLLGAPVTALVEQYTSVVDIMKSEIEVSINEIRLQQISDKILATYQNMLQKQRKKIIEMKTGIQAKLKTAKDEGARIIKKYGDTSQNKWSAADQKRYKECETAVVNCNKSIATLDVITKKLGDITKSIQEKDSKTFKSLLSTYMRELSTLSSQIKAVDSFSQLSVFADSSKKPLTFKNQSKNIEFYVDGILIEPGKSSSITVKNRKVSIRALAVTERRKFIRTKAPANNTHIDKRNDWQFTYTVTIPGGAGSDTATWKVSKEVYKWNSPKLLLTTKKPFDCGKTIFSKSKADSDVMTWDIPIISAQQFGSGSLGTQSFFISVSGEIAWTFDRSGAVSQTVHKTESEIFYGDMIVMVPSE